MLWQAEKSLFKARLVLAPLVKHCKMSKKAANRKCGTDRAFNKSEKRLKVYYRMIDSILRDTLTVKPGPNGEVLFKNASKLADEIMELPSSGYEKTEKDRRSVAAFLSQVFRGERSCSSKLENLILGAVEARLAKQKPEVRASWAGQVRDAISKQNTTYQNAEATAPIPDSRELYAELLERAARAKLQFIVTSMTLEEAASKRGDDLREILIRRLRLEEVAHGSQKITGTHGSISAEPECDYIFLLPGEDSARGFWENLYTRLTSLSRVTQPLLPLVASKALDDLDRKDHLQVHVAQISAVCGVPIVAFDPDVKRPDPSAFSFCFDEDDHIRIIKWDAQASAAWKTSVYRQFTTKGLRYSRYRWERARQFIDDFLEPSSTPN